MRNLDDDDKVLGTFGHFVFVTGFIIVGVTVGVTVGAIFGAIYTIFGDIGDATISGSGSAIVFGAVVGGNIGWIGGCLLGFYDVGRIYRGKHPEDE